MPTVIDIIDKALLLQDRERAQIAEQLISSLDRVVAPSREVELAWQQEIERRLNQIDSGEVKCCPGKKYETICGENIVPKVEIHISQIVAISHHHQKPGYWRHRLQ
jgi:putative addiction module component (TIGR02574 family)